MNAKNYAFALCFVVACAPTVPKNQVIAYGLAGGKNHSVARTAAQNRAIASLQWMMAVDAVSFTYRVAGQDSALETTSVAAAGKFESTEFVPLANGWASKAVATRSQAVADAMAAMTFAMGSGEARREDPGVAMLVAQTRAVRAVLAPLAADCAEAGCKLTGTLTIKEIRPEFFDDGIKLTLVASAKVVRQDAAVAEDRAAAHVASAVELAQEKRWAQALESLDRAISETPDAGALYAQRGTLLSLRGPAPRPAAAPAAATAPAGPAEDQEKPAKIANLKEIVAAFTRAAELDTGNEKYKRDLADAQAKLALLEPPPPPVAAPETKTPAAPPKKKAGKKHAK
ncbi:MAG: hypothetical protein HY903_08620 [Deltaproteobacteria bacterium]|nr:hypothetical protein [Deltaproteobacteria bacterium]